MLLILKIIIIFICKISNYFTCLTTRIGYFYWMVSECEELVGEVISGGLAMFGTSHTVKKAVSSKAVELIYGNKSDMSRREPRKARKTR